MIFIKSNIKAYFLYFLYVLWNNNFSHLISIPVKKNSSLTKHPLPVSTKENKKIFILAKALIN